MCFSNDRVTPSTPTESSTWAAVLVHASTTSHVDYCNCLLAGAPKSTTAKLQLHQIHERCRSTHHQHMEVLPRSHAHAARCPSLVGRQWSDKIPSVCHGLQMCYMKWHLMSDVPLMENGRLPMLAHLLVTHYLTIYSAFHFQSKLKSHLFADY